MSLPCSRRSMRPSRVLSALVAALVLAGCGSDPAGPTTPRYAVGGTLSGLLASKSVTLTNNGGDPLALSGNGPFAFAGHLADGAAYAVSVGTQPTGMFCAVQNGSGNVAAADVTTVAVDCGAITTALDTTYGAAHAGFVSFDGGSGADDSGNDVALDGSGRAVVAGYSRNSSTGALEMAIWRVDATGALDAGFGGTGHVTHPGDSVTTGSNLPEVIGTGVAIDGSGRIVVAGYDIDAAGLWGVAVWRFLANGTPDAAFGTGGFARSTAPQGGGVGVALDASGRIVVAGFAWNGSDWDGALWRFTDAGIPDSTFNGVGYVTNNASEGSGVTTGEDIGVGVGIDNSGRIVMAGYSSSNAGNQDMTVWRFLDTGALDASFNGGVFRHDNAGGGGGNDVGRAVAFTNGNIVVGGWSPSAGGGDDAAVWRLTGGGVPDPSFNGSGFNTVNGTAGGNGTDTGRDLVVDSLGNAYLIGESANAAGDADMAVWRFGPDGRLDGHFGGTGALVHGAAAGGTGGSDGARGIAIDAANRLVVAGRSAAVAGTLDMVVWRIVP